MARPLRILLIEHCEDVARVLLDELRRGGYAPMSERVETEPALRAALAQPWDVITSNYVLPQFSAAAALQLLQAQRVDVPVIIVSGEVGEEIAVTAMKAGAHDYVSTHKLARLVPAVERELR
jgi:DNA-binding NtrC family response regulator